MEILWPLILFLILVAVRTRGLRKFNHQCKFFSFLTASKYCGRGLKIDLVVVVVILLVVIKLLSNSMAFSSFNVINIFCIV